MNIIILCNQTDCIYNKEMYNEATVMLSHQCSHPTPNIALNLKFLKEQKCTSKQTAEPIEKQIIGFDVLKRNREIEMEKSNEPLT